MPKGYCPTSDPNWHHTHVYQGRNAQCQRPGCNNTWPVMCHQAGRKRYCSEVCVRAAKRDTDRAAKRRTRAEEAQHDRALLAASVRAMATTGMTSEELQAYVPRWWAMRRIEKETERQRRISDKAKQEKRWRQFTAGARRAIRKLSADQVHTEYKHHGGKTTKGVDADVLRDMRTGDPEHGGAGAPQEVRHQALQEPSGASQDQAPRAPGSDSGAGNSGADVSKPLPRLPSRSPTAYPCCQQAAESGQACRQHREVIGLHFWYAPSRRGDVEDDKLSY
jgi:hypothetical protein